MKSILGLFPERQEEWSMQRGDSWDLLKWTTLDGVTFVTTWDHDHLLNNIRANYLPHEKMCIHPPRDNFEGSLAIEFWKDLGQAICCRQLNLEHPITRTIFYTQQFVFYLGTGRYGPPYRQ